MERGDIEKRKGTRREGVDRTRGPRRIMGNKERENIYKNGKMELTTLLC